jgi:hypothetical protein
MPEIVTKTPPAIMLKNNFEISEVLNHVTLMSDLEYGGSVGLDVCLLKIAHE